MTNPNTRKPRLVFFQWDHRPNQKASKFLSVHMALHVRCLQDSFEVTVVSEDCDYSEICERHRPDLCLFEAGYRTHGSRRLRITNTSAHAGIPKLALHNGDPWCDRRAGLLSDMDDWGIETIFAIGTATPAYLPAQADRIFVWPNFIDPELFRDRGTGKVIPVMLIGQSGALYPWRNTAYEVLSTHYPCLVTPPFGYEDAAAQRLLSGRSYAEALGASWLSPSCGTMGHELVRKHLEIPGAGSLLLTEQTPVLEAAGFRDGETCVFAKPEEILEKVDALMADPDRMRQISTAGRALVHARHTLHHRTQIREWFDLNRSLSSEERIVQPGPFAPLEIVPTAAFRGHGHMKGTGLDRAALLRAEDCLARFDIKGARAAFSVALDFVPYLPEGKLGLSRCDLEAGRPEDAFRRLSDMIKISVADYGASHPDPVEWAFCLIALLACGRADDALLLRDRYPMARHPELSHVLRILDRLAGDSPRAQSAPAADSSIHRLPLRGPAEFDRWLANILEQAQAAPGASTRTTRAGWRLWLDRVLVALRADTLRPGLPAAPGFGYGAALRDALARQVVPPHGRRAVRRLAGLLRRPGPK